MSHDTPSAEPTGVSGAQGLLAQASGFVTSGSGLASSADGAVAVMLSVVFGGFCGMMGGFVIAQISRYVGYLLGRNFWVGRWVLLGAVAGALAFGIKAWVVARD